MSEQKVSRVHLNSRRAGAHRRGPPRLVLRPLALACLLALGVQAPVQAANCNAGTFAALSSCISGAGAGDTITLTGNIALTGTLPAVPNNVTILGATGFTGTGALNKDGAAQLTVTNTGNSYTGATNVNAGTLQAGSMFFAFGSNSAVTVAAGATLDLNNFAESIGSLSGAGSVTLGTAILTTGGDGTSTVFSGGISGTGGLKKTGTGVLTLSGTNLNTYSGATTLTVGTLQAGAANAFSANSAINASSGTTVDLNNFAQTTGLVINGGNIVTGGTGGVLTESFNGSLGIYSGVMSGAGSLVLDATGGGGLVLEGNNTYSGTTTITGGTLHLGFGGVTTGTLGTGSVSIGAGAALDLNRSGANFTVANDISGAGGLAKNGTGTAILTSNNNAYGTTSVVGGTLQVGDGTANGTLGTGTVSISAGATLAFDRPDTLVVANRITGAGAVHQLGTGTTVLTSAVANSYSGGTTIDAGGTLQVGNGNAGGSLGSGVVTDNGSLVFNRSDVITVSNAISGSGSVTQQGSFVTLSGANTYSGNTNLVAGVLQAQGANTLSANSVVVMTAGTLLDVNNSAQTVAGLQGGGSIGTGSTSGVLTVNTATGTSYDYSGTISGGGSLVKGGAGTQRLSGSNSYSGGTTISNGVLEITNANSLGSGVLNINGGGALVTDNSMNLSTGLLTIDTGGGKIAAAGGTTLNYTAGGFNFSNPANLVFGDATNNGTVVLSVAGGS
ncbi:MAG TPA: autotransporter-associated beta strand repeat-containing protein, partial [Burkholderiales bacterium]|nr:autotransporter-associated beta strand repeat-containing protein [Burkholderiales bacterium]